MFTPELINHTLPRLKLQDTTSKALQLLNDFRVSHLPVVNDDDYLGLIGENELLDAEHDQVPIEALQRDFIVARVHENSHFLAAVNFCNQQESTLAPIVSSDQKYLGSVTVTDLLRTLGEFSGADSLGGIIVMQMERSQFAISEISRIVESNDATLLHLNTTVHPATGLLTVTLHLNKREISPIVATFNRYEYEVIYQYGDTGFEDDMRDNYRHLMNYLNM